MPREIILRTWPFLDSIMSRAPTAVKRRRFTQRIIRRLVKQWVSVCPNKYNRWPWVMPFVLAANAPHFHPAKLYIESQSGYRFNWLTIGHGRGEQSREQSLLFSIHPSETAIHSSFVYVISISFVLRLDVFTESIEIYGSKRIFVFFLFLFYSAPLIRIHWFFSRKGEYE